MLAIAAIAIAFTAHTAAQIDDGTPPPIDDVENAPPTPLPARKAPVVTTTKTTTTTQVSAESDASAHAPAPKKSNDLAEGATFFGGVRTAMAFPPGGDGPAPMAGVEVGVAAEKGVGYG